MQSLRILALVLLLSLAVPGQAQQSVTDTDRDGISDTLEQSLLDKFAPTFFVSASECDTLPATFQSDTADPVVLARDGRIYGQASPLAFKTSPNIALELHYYHLWGRDCGRIAHPLDAEHVSVVVSGPSPDSPASAWRADYWYAAAHERTVCEASRWTTAAALGAVESGPKVWISSGKHASYLSLELCHGGCGGDRCDKPKQIPQLKVINLGECNAPMNGALWVSSKQWQLAEKMTSNFPEPILAELRKTPVVEMKHSNSKQAIISNSSTTYGGLEIGANHTGDGMGTGTKHTGRALGTAYRSVKNGLRWAFTGGKKPSPPAKADAPSTPPPPPAPNPPADKRDGNSQ